MPFFSKSTHCIRYIHIALWVRKVVLNKLDGGFHFKRPVGSLCIVPEEVSHRSDVELCIRYPVVNHEEERQDFSLWGSSHNLCVTDTLTCKS